MKRSCYRTLSCLCTVVVLALPAMFASAQTAAPTTQAVKTTLDHVLKRIDAASTPRLMDTRTNTPVTEIGEAGAAPATPDAAPAAGGRRGGGGGGIYAIDAPNSAGRGGGSFAPTAYPYAIIYNGMLNVFAQTGDAKYANFTAKWMTFIHDMAPKTAA
jgi:hypothetical protein